MFLFEDMVSVLLSLLYSILIARYTTETKSENRQIKIDMPVALWKLNDVLTD